MKTLLISSFHPHISRNILETDAFEKIKADKDVRMVLVVPAHKVSYFAERFAGERVFVEGIRLYQSSATRMGLFFKKLAMLSFETGTTRAKKGYKYYWDRKFFYFVGSVALGMLGKNIFFRRAVRVLDLTFSPRHIFDALFERYEPDLLFSTDPQNENDTALMQEARRRKVPILGMLRSWDNPTQRVLRVFPEKLLVGSAELLREVFALYGDYPRERISVVGNPHYDRYLKGPTKTKQEFFRACAFDPSKPLIVYAPGGDKIIRHNDLDQCVMETLAKTDYQIFVRYPPGEDITLQNFVQPKRMVIDKPGHRFGRENEFEITPEDDERLVNTMVYADVVTTGPTSIALDAAFFDTPVVLANFYPTERHIYKKTWGFLLDHVKKLIATGGVRLAESPRNFLAEIEAYLKDRSRDRQGRARIRQIWFSHADGKSGERIARAALEMLHSSHASQKK